MDILLNNPAETAAFYLGLAINHFVSTSDHVGVAPIMAVGRESPFCIIPVNKLNPVDKDDFERFRERFLWVKPQLLLHGIQADLDERPYTSIEEFDAYRLTVPLETNDIMLMAAIIARSPEPTGWGSFKGDVHRLFEADPKVRDRFQAFMKDVTPFLTSAARN